MRGQDYGDPISATATHATAAVAAVTGIAGKTHYITDITVSSDKANSIFLVKQGTTTIWQGQLLQTAAGNSVFEKSWATPLAAAQGALVSVEVDGTARCDANIAGYTL